MIGCHSKGKNEIVMHIALKITCLRDVTKTLFLTSVRIGVECRPALAPFYLLRY